MHRIGLLLHNGKRAYWASGFVERTNKSVGKKVTKKSEIRKRALSLAAAASSSKMLMADEVRNMCPSGIIFSS
jgi:hypothetical protein